VTEAEIISIVRRHIDRKFPKKCSKCGVVYRSLAEYLRNTTHIGPPVSYDAELGIWTPIAPIGTISIANCRCGTSLAIDSEGIGLWSMIRMLHWARRETRTRGVSMNHLLEEIRAKIDEQVLAEEEAPRLSTS
jgi:hypothetical protein